MIINIDPYQDKFLEDRIPNGKYRYRGRHRTIDFIIHANTRKTEKEINSFLDSKSVDYLINNEGHIIFIN